MKIKKTVATLLTFACLLSPTAAMAEEINQGHIVSENVIIVEPTTGIRPFAWYHSLPCIYTTSGDVNTSVTSSAFTPRENIYVVSNCEAKYIVGLDIPDDEYGWRTVQESTVLSANVTNEVPFSDEEVAGQSRCLVRLSKASILPLSLSNYSLTIYDAS